MSSFEFIFMLTRHDRTVADAARHLATALAAGVRHIGFKDIGLPMAELEGLHRSIRDHGASSYLEVVSLDRDSEIASVEMACRLGVDHLLGGTHVDDVLPLLEGMGIRYYPFAGRVSGIRACSAARSRRSWPAPARSRAGPAWRGWTCWPTAPRSTCRG